MKKIISFLIIVMLLSSTVASADQHLEVQCAVSGSPENRTVSFDLYEQDNKVTAVSSLFGDYAVELSANESYSLADLFRAICTMQPADASECEQGIERLLTSCLEQKLSDPVYGVYAGALFTRAVSVRNAEIPLPDISESLRAENAAQAFGTKTGPVSGMLVSFVSRMLGDLVELGSGSMLSVQSFDQGKYITFQVMKQGNVIMTVSADRTPENGRHILTCFRENGRYYFHRIITSLDREQYVFRTSLLSSPSSILNAPGQETLFSERLAIDKEPDENISFRYELNSQSLSRPLKVNGSGKAYEDGRADLKVFVGIDGVQDNTIVIDMGLEPFSRPVSFDDKTIIRSADAVESAGFTLSAVSNIAELAAQLLPTLPNDYQDLILRLLYP